MQLTTRVHVVGSGWLGFGLSHDLDCHVYLVNGLTEMALIDAGVGLEVERIVANTVRMGELIDAILDFSRIGSKSPQVQRINPAAMVREVVASHPGYRDDKRVRVDIGTLPDTLADPILFRQVWQNLIDNALKFSRAQPRSEVTVPGGVPSYNSLNAVSPSARIARGGCSAISVSRNALQWSMAARS